MTEKNESDKKEVLTDTSTKKNDIIEGIDDLPSEVKSVATKSGKYYLTNKELLPAVIEAKQKGFVTDKLARMLMLLATMYSKKANYAGYSYREDMVSEALVNLCKNALKFDPEKSQNPFAYYTTAIDRSFLQYMAEEKKQHYVRDTLLINQGKDPSHNYENNQFHKKIVEKEKEKAQKEQQKKTKKQLKQEKEKAEEDRINSLLDF